MNSDTHVAPKHWDLLSSPVYTSWEQLITSKVSVDKSRRGCTKDVLPKTLLPTPPKHVFLEQSTGPTPGSSQSTRDGCNPRGEFRWFSRTNFGPLICRWDGIALERVTEQIGSPFRGSTRTPSRHRKIPVWSLPGLTSTMVTPSSSRE